MEWIDFLLRAKRATYAAAGGADAHIMEDGAKELVYTEGGCIYRDRY